jgi:hypothetical protein
MKLTHDQQVRQALNVLKPPQDAHAQCESDIEEALQDIMMDGVEAKPYSKNTKAVVAPLLASLTKTQSLYDKLLPLDDYGLMMPLDLSEHIALYKEWLDESSDKRSRSAPKQKAAVKEARALVLKYCKSKKEHSKKRGNDWHKLSAILVGDDQLDLFNHMRKT